MPDAVAPPAVDVPLAGVVRGQGELRVAVAVAQVVEVPRSVADVDLRVAEIGDDEAVAAGAERDPLGRLGEELHEADGACGRLRVRVEAALGVDDGGEQSRVEVVVLRVPAEDVLVRERIPGAEVPVRLRLDHPRGDGSDAEDDGCGGNEDLHAREARQAARVRPASTSATHASSSSGVPVLT